MIALYGAGHLGCQISSELEKEHVFIDDIKSQKCDELNSIKVYDLASFLSSYDCPNTIIFICIFQPGFCYQKLKTKIQKSSNFLTVEPFTKILLNRNSLLPFLFFEKPNELLLKWKEYQRLRLGLFDDLSRETLDGHLQLRLNGDFKSLVTEKRYSGKIQEIIKNNTFTYIDLGGNIGETAISFIDCANERLVEAHIFEPDPINLSKARNNTVLKKLNNVFFHRVALADKKGKVGFVFNGNFASKICKSSTDMVQAITLSELPSAKNLFIKFDIEGMEFPALSAAVSFITLNRPLLAISVYHEPDDIIRTARLLMDLDLNYEFLLRCHGHCGEDLMLYAIPIELLAKKPVTNKPY